MSVSSREELELENLLLSVPYIKHYTDCAAQNMARTQDDIGILLCAYAGLAAFNIQGSTLHNAFSIEPNKKLKYKPLSDDKRNTLKTKYRFLTVLVVDEVSMVGNDMLSFLYLRLQEIKGNRKPFGGVHVILVGDLFQLRPVQLQTDGYLPTILETIHH